MKKVLYFVVAIICLLIVLLLALPKYFSTQNKQYLQAFIQNIEKNYNYEIKGTIISDKKGWFKSQAVVQFSYDPISLTNKKEQPLNFTTNLTTYYGPLLVTDDGVKFGQSYTVFKLMNNKESKKYFASPLMSGKAFNSFAGTVSLSVSGLKTVKNDLFSFAGLNGSANINAHATKFVGSINFGQLDVTANENGETIKAKIAPFKQTFNLARENPDSFWTGSKSMTLPSIDIMSEDMNATLKNSVIESKIDSDKQHTNFKFIVNVPKFTVNQQTGTFETQLNFANLNTQKLHQLQALLVDLDNTNTLSQQELKQVSQKILQNAIDIFSGNSMLQFDSQVSLKDLGSVTVNTGYKNSDQNSNFYFNSKVKHNQKQLASVDLAVDNVNKKTIGKLLHLSDSVNVNDIDALNAQVEKLLPKLFDNESKISFSVKLPAGTDSDFQLMEANLTFPELENNQTSVSNLEQYAKLHVNWKLPVYATQLVQVFAPMIISKMDDPQQKQEAEETYKVFKELLPFMINNGLLTRENNYYISNWLFTKQSSTINDKPMQVLFSEIYKLYHPKTEGNKTNSNIEPSKDINSYIPKIVLTAFSK